MLKILPYSDCDKSIEIVDYEDNFRMEVDYDDVDHKKVLKRTKAIVKLCNEHNV